MFTTHEKCQPLRNLLYVVVFAVYMHNAEQVGKRFSQITEKRNSKKKDGIIASRHDDVNFKSSDYRIKKF